MTHPATTGDSRLPRDPAPGPAYERSAVIDLEAIRHNVRTGAATASPAQVMAVVKADAYGHGAGPVAGPAGLESRTSPKHWL
jgi:alanine racemase